MTRPMPATSNGRPLDLEPVLVRRPLDVQPVRPETTLPCGFRQGWVQGEGPEGLTFSVSTSLHGPMVILSILKDGETIDEFIDLTDAIGRWVSDAVVAGPTPEHGTPVVRPDVVTRDTRSGEFVLDAFKREQGAPDGCVEEDQVSMADLLTALRHAADARGIDFDEAVEQSERYHGNVLGDRG